jgi:hypothetical protein
MVGSFADCCARAARGNAAAQRDEFATPHGRSLSPRIAAYHVADWMLPLCIATNLPIDGALWVIHLGLIRLTNSWHVRCTSDSSRISALQRSDEECQQETFAAMRKNAKLNYSITSSAIARMPGGMSRRRAFAVLRLMTKSNLVDCCTGRSAGFSPLRMRPT